VGKNVFHALSLPQQIELSYHRCPAGGAVTNAEIKTFCRNK
jgi:hypothetical protein